MKSWNFLLLFFSVMLFSTKVFSHDNKCDSIEVPIAFDQYGLPTIELVINGQSKFVLLDLGSTAGIHLPISDVNRIADVKYTGKISKSTNISGEIFYSKEFKIPSLAIECMTFENIIGYELSPWAASIGEQEEEKNNEQKIVIGQGFFVGKTIVINYATKTLKISNKAETITSKSNQFVPYVLSDEGITLKMKSSIADYQMVLDTGSTSSIFSADKVNAKEQLIDCDYNLGPDIKCKLFNSHVNIAGHDFMPNILLYPMNPRFTKDGLLGTDFFNDFIVEIDFENQKIALTPSESHG